ncbi:hypothetical protein MPLB_1870053 [Mesorhizobium sp. ORS 3324]|nr:hypothetical protein MPLB_1870053 [Mesorhizobium sp. ORS 3324]
MSVQHPIALKSAPANSIRVVVQAAQATDIAQRLLCSVDLVQVRTDPPLTSLHLCANRLS